MIGPLGRRSWVIAAGRLPVHSRGKEPELTGRDELAVLNSGPEDVRLEVTILYSEREPVGPHQLTVAAERVRVLRMTDLIDPEAIPLGEDYAAVLTASAPVVVQHFRLDSGLPTGSIFSTLAYPVDD